MKGKTLILAIAAAAITAPGAAAGTGASLVSEKAAGLWPAPQSSAPLVSEKTAGLFQAPQSSAPLVSEKTAGLFQAPPPSTPVFAAQDSGFDWSDAAVGAGVALASLLAASTGAFAMRRRGMLAH